MPFVEQHILKWGDYPCNPVNAISRGKRGKETKLGDVKVRSWVFIFLSLLFAIVLLCKVPASVCFFSTL